MDVSCSLSDTVADMDSVESEVAYPPYITDPRYLALAEGTSYYAVMRPTEVLAAAYSRVQEAVRSLGFEGLSYPAPHLTLKAFGEADEADVVAVVEGWASNVGPVLTRFEAIDSFPDFEVLIAKVERHDSLVTAMTELRHRAEGLAPGFEDAIPIDSWVFHMSLAYANWISEADWADLQDRTADLDLELASDHVSRVDLLVFNGGPERLVGTYELRG